MSGLGYRMKVPRMTAREGMTRAQRHMMRDLGHRDSLTIHQDDAERSPDAVMARVSEWIAAWQYVHKCDGVVMRTGDPRALTITLRMSRKAPER